MINSFDLDIAVVVNSTVSATQLVYRVSGPFGILQDWETVALVAPYNAPGPIGLNIDRSLNKPTSILADFNSDFSQEYTYDTSSNLVLQPEGRVVEVQLLNDSDAILQAFTLDYTLTGGIDTLVIMGNTFQSYAEAIGNSFSLVNLKSWPSATSEDRMRFMINAFYALARLSYDLYEDFNDVDQKNRAGWGYYNFDQVMNLSLYNADQFNQLRPDFVRAIKMAQIVEADARMSGDSAADARDSGIISEVIGPSSTNYRSTKSVTYSIDKRTVRALNGFLNKTPRLTRL